MAARPRVRAGQGWLFSPAVPPERLTALLTPARRGTDAPLATAAGS
ncbi:hypothetical protein ACUN7V_14330 [Quadrisphaera oryzae]